MAPRLSKLAILCSTASCALGGCSRNVDLSLDNPLNIPQSVTIQEYAGDQAPTGPAIYTGDIPAGATKSYPLSSIRVGHYLNVTGQAGKQERVTVVKGNGPEEVSVILPASGQLLTDAESAQQIVNAFLVIGPQTGFPPDDITDALTTVVGAVRCYVPPTQDHPFSTVVWSKPPGVFSDIVPMPSPYPYPSGTSSAKAQITSGASASVGASVPVYGSLKAQVSSTGLDQWDVQYINFGAQNKRENLATFKGIPDALNRLSEPDKQALLHAMTVPNIVCTYFDSYYVMQTLNVSVEHSKKVTSSADVSGATIFTADGAYNYDSSSTQSATLSDKVLNVWGDNFTVTRDAASTPGNTTLIYAPVAPGEIPAGAGSAAAAKPAPAT